MSQSVAVSPLRDDGNESESGEREVSNRFTASYDSKFHEYNVTIEIDYDADADANARIVKNYWRNPLHTHWVENESLTIISKQRNRRLWEFLNSLVVSIMPSQETLDGIYAQVRKPR